MKKNLPVLLFTILFMFCACGQNSTSSEPTVNSAPEVTQATVPVESTAPSGKPTLPEDYTPTSSTSPSHSDSSHLDGPFGEYYQLLQPTYGQDNWIRSAMTCVFDDPRDLDLYYFFYSGFVNDGCDWWTLSDGEAAFLTEQEFNPICEIQLLAPDAMNAVLLETYGIPLNDIVKGIPEKWTYFEETGNYYTNHNDAYVVIPEITDVQETDDGLIQIFYTPDQWSSIVQDGVIIERMPMVLTLRPMEDGKFQVVSNQILAD